MSFSLPIKTFTLQKRDPVSSNNKGKDSAGKYTKGKKEFPTPTKTPSSCLVRDRNFERVLAHLSRSVFTHGKLYVLFSKGAFGFDLQIDWSKDSIQGYLKKDSTNSSVRSKRRYFLHRSRDREHVHGLEGDQM